MDINDLIGTLIAYAATVTGLPAATPVEIVELSSPQMQEVAASGKGAAYRDGYVFAAERDGRIWIDDKFSLYDPVDQSILLHEIVHVLQDASKKHYPCQGVQEKQAYAVQAIWLLFGMQ